MKKDFWEGCMEELNEPSMVFKFIDHVAPIKGILRYKVYKSGVLVEEIDEQNLVVNTAKEQLARLISGDFNGRNITKISFGENGILPNEADTTITAPFTKNISGVIYPDVGQVQFNWELTINEANGKGILEFGLICADGTLFSRRAREKGKPLNKESDISIIGQWIIIF
jgi:hypothetical protein